MSRTKAHRRGSRVIEFLYVQRLRVNTEVDMRRVCIWQAGIVISRRHNWPEGEYGEHRLASAWEKHGADADARIVRQSTAT